MKDENIFLYIYVFIQKKRLSWNCWKQERWGASQLYLKQKKFIYTLYIITKLKKHPTVSQQDRAKREGLREKREREQLDHAIIILFFLRKKSIWSFTSFSKKEKSNSNYMSQILHFSSGSPWFRKKKKACVPVVHCFHITFQIYLMTGLFVYKIDKYSPATKGSHA